MSSRFTVSVSSFRDTPQCIAVFLKAQMAGLTTHERKPGDMIKYHMTKKMGCPAFCCLNILEIPSFLLDKIKKNPPVIEHINISMKYQLFLDYLYTDRKLPYSSIFNDYIGLPRDNCVVARNP